MAGPSNSMRLDDKICNELWNEDEFSDDSVCDGDMVVKFLSDSEQIGDSDDEDNVNVHLEDPNNLLVYFELLITPELAELISRETNWYAQQFLENIPNLKIRPTVHHWSNTNR
jgi:hypothetical protein